MDHQSNDHGSGEGIHLPDPSVWPLIVGVGSLILGATLVWWAHNPSGSITGPLLGAAVVVVLVAVGGWAYEDGRMKAKAEDGHHGPGPRAPRYTQVVTFAVPEGQLEAARTGVLEAIENTDNILHSLGGFQDLRIIASPAATGPAQVLIETTWSGRDELATYEETRRTMLDLLSRHADQVMAGTVQVFDMEVVRDTKDVSFRFPLAGAAALLGSLAVGGFMVGAGLTLFQSEGGGGGGGGTAPAPVQDTSKVIATDNKFNVTTLQAPPNTDVTFNLVNQGNSPHNLHFLTAKGGQTLAAGAEGKIITTRGGTDAVSFKTPGAGDYYFLCDVHPDQMNGVFKVADGAPVPGSGGATTGS